MEMDLSSRESIVGLIRKAQEFGPVKMLVNAAGVSPSHAPVEAVLKVDLYGTAVLLEEVGKVIAPGGTGVTISSQSGWRRPALTAEQDRYLATAPTEELLDLDILQPENVRDSLHAYQLAKRCNEKRVMAESVKWGERGGASMTSLRASSSHRLPSMNSTDQEAIFTRTCSRNARPADPARRMKSPMWLNF